MLYKFNKLIKSSNGSGISQNADWKQTENINSKSRQTNIENHLIFGIEVHHNLINPNNDEKKNGAHPN